METIAKETVLVMSATRYLFETFIYSEVIDLSKKYDIVVLAEYDDIPDSVHYRLYPFYRPNLIKKLPPLLRSFIALRYYKKMAEDLLLSKSIRAVIIHTDSDINTNVFIDTLKKGQVLKVLLRRPSMVLYPQQDFKWQSKISHRPVLLQQLILLIKKIYFEVILASLILNTPMISRTAFWITKKRMWVPRKKYIYDNSFCYSEICRNHLSTIFELSTVLSLKSTLTETYCSPTFSKDILFISSNYGMILSYELNIELLEAQRFYQKIVIELAKDFINVGFNFNIKFKSEDEFIFPDEIKERITVISKSDNLYVHADRHAIIIGMVGTPLWYYANKPCASDKKIFAIRLTESEYFNYFHDNENVITIDKQYDFKKNILDNITKRAIVSNQEQKVRLSLVDFV
jgi:hypothetical protein